MLAVVRSGLYAKKHNKDTLLERPFWGWLVDVAWFPLACVSWLTAHSLPGRVGVGILVCWCLLTLCGLIFGVQCGPCGGVSNSCCLDAGPRALLEVLHVMNFFTYYM